jgi:chaperonin GroES
MPNEQPIEPIEIEEEPEESQEQEILSIMDQLEARHAMTNIAEDLEQDVIDTIAAKVVDDYNTDKDSRSVWEESNRELMKLAKLDSEKKTYAGERVANVKYPIITNAAIQFAARAYPEIIKGSDVVKPKVIGEDPDGQKAERGKRLCDHMSYQLLNDMPDWEDGVDQMLFTLPVVGCAFKKTYYSAVESQNISEMVFPDDLVVHYHAVSLEKASRITHIIELTRNEVVERIRSGVYLDFDVEELGPPSNEDNDSVDEDTPHKFLEQHRWYDLDKDGYQEPYIVTVHLATQKLVRISARFELKGVETNDKDEIVRIKPTHYFTRFLFMPAPDGSFYGMGFGSLLHSINSATNTALNQLLDAGTLSNRQSGFLGRGIQLGRGASLKFQSGEWKPVQTTGDDLRKNIVPLPTKEPSHVLFQLLGLLIDTGKELSGITEVLSGQSPGSNVPAETTLALIEQGLQVYSATHKRIHRSLYREFQKIRRLNVLYLSDEEYSTVLDSPKAIRRQDYENSDLDIIPVSDSNATTNMQRIMKAKALFEIKGQGLNDEEINKRYLEALQVENIDELIPKEQEPDPILELEIETKKAELGKIMAEQGKLAADTELTVEKINTERNDQQVKQSGVVFDQSKLDLERAEIIASIKEREDKLKLETARLISGIENDKKKIDIDSKKIDNSKIEGKNAETSTKGYNEKGMKSNNVKQ